MTITLLIDLDDTLLGNQIDTFVSYYTRALAEHLSASVEPNGFARLVRDIETIQAAMGDGVKQVYESEVPILKKLRRVKTAAAQVA